MMRHYDFDTLYDRRGTSSLKYDFAMQRVGRTDLLPLWVADMDFRLPEEIPAVLKERADHGFFGYTDPDSAYYDTLEKWFADRYRVRIDRSWNTVTPGIVYAISCAIRSFTKEGDAVLIQEPVYYPFREMIEKNGRVCVSSDLVLREAPELHFEIDFADLEETLRTSHPKLMLLCSPHNPAGRVFSREELERIADLCLRYDVLLLADEIHCDFIFEGHAFTSLLSLDERILDRAIICTSASKSFSIAGLQTANILIPNPDLRRRFGEVNAATGYSQGNVFGLAATKAAYDLGGAWLDELGAYLQGNLDFVRDYLKERLPQLRLVEPEGTYLLLVDFGNVVKTYGELRDLIQNRAHLWLDDGILFGRKTALFERFNIACPRSVLEQAFSQLEAAVKEERK